MVSQIKQGGIHYALVMGFDCRCDYRCHRRCTTSKGQSMGWLSNIIAGLIGSSLGEALLGSWGPQLAGMAIIPSIIGAIILVALVSFIMSRLNMGR